MKKCFWIIDPTTGDHILIKNGTECGRIREGENTRMDEGRPGAAHISLKQLKSEIEKECGC